MRVLLVSANFRPSVGGIERFTEVLGTGLVHRGHEVTVLCCRKDRAPLREASAGLEIVRLPATYALQEHLRVPYPLPAPWALPRTLSRLLRFADVVHVQDALYATSVATLLAARGRRVPSVLTQHVAFVPQASAMLDKAERVAIGTLGRCARLATAVATLNPAVADWVTATWGVAATVLPVGVPASTSDGADREATRAALGLPPDRFIALFVGRDVSKKGLDHFLAAADESYGLVAVTDRVVGGDDRARFLPFMRHADLQLLLAAVDAFVLPSVGEGFPVVIQEALALGVPVVTTPGPGYDRYLSPEEVVFVDASGEAIRTELRRLAADPELRARLAERGRLAAEREFGVDRFVAAYEALYERVRTARRTRG